uniref:Co-chaperonin GroES n=1 Tax=uncultured virus TaxID=340016 RepID=A0A221S3C8_9VIRU|nr:co-chaperonin GroES [uncultured virus]
MEEVKMIKPLADRVLIKPREAMTKTASGLFIPDIAQEKPQEGVVVAVGDGMEGVPMRVSEGDLVMYGKYSGTELKFDGNDYLIMREADLFAII